MYFHHWRPLEAACGHIIHLPCFCHVDCEVCSNPTHIKFIFRISLFLDPYFILKYFFIPKFWLSTPNESELEAKRSSFESNNLFMKGHLLHKIWNGDQKNKNKIKINVKTHFTTNLEENKEFQALFITNVLFLMSSIDLTLMGKIKFSP